MIGQKIIFKETLDSTNNYAANLLERGELAHGTVIMSGEQTAGRGQRGTSWAAEPYKNLIFTCFLQYDNLSVENQQSITHLVSLSVIQVLKTKGIDAMIKWPNDILVGNSKISGILIENQLESARCKSSIIGIGLNVNQTNFGDFNATSMQLVKEEVFSMEAVSMLLIERLQANYEILQRLDYATLKQQYLDHLWLKGEISAFEDKDGVFQGIILGTDPFGRLLVENNQQVKSYDLKEIKFLERNASGAY